MRKRGRYWACARSILQQQLNRTLILYKEVLIKIAAGQFTTLAADIWSAVDEKRMWQRLIVLIGVEKATALNNWNCIVVNNTVVNEMWKELDGVITAKEVFHMSLRNKKIVIFRNIHDHMHPLKFAEQLGGSSRIKDYASLQSRFLRNFIWEKKVWFNRWLYYSFMSSVFSFMSRSIHFPEPKMARMENRWIAHGTMGFTNLPHKPPGYRNLKVEAWQGKCVRHR